MWKELYRDGDTRKAGSSQYYLSVMNTLSNSTL